MKREKQILASLTLIRDLEFIKGSILSQLQDQLREMIDADKQNQKDSNQAEMAF
jgi:hypothetical protein